MENKIYGAICDIMKDIGSIGKEKSNQQQGYKFRGVDDVYNALQPVLVKHRVFPVPIIIEERREDRTSSKGNALIYTILKMKYRLYADDGSFVEAETIGEGMDSGDKSANKAMSVAYKYAMFQLLCIPTEAVDPDGETHEVARKADLISTEQKEEIYIEQVKSTGLYDTVTVKNEAVDIFVRAWQSKGVGWVCERLGDNREIPGMTDIVCYYGSSVYDAKQFSRLVDAVATECKELGIAYETGAFKALLEDK